MPNPLTQAMIIWSARGHITDTGSAPWSGYSKSRSDDPQPALGAFGRYGRGGGGLMASIERRVLDQRDGPGRVRRVVHYKVRYRDPDGRAHGETFARRVDAERRRTEIEASLVSATWLDPRRARSRSPTGPGEWLPTRHDLRLQPGGRG